MRQALTIHVVVLAAMHSAFLVQGYDGAAGILYGALTIMGVMIAATFLWLWAMKMSPLALGLAFAWAGAAMVAGWWWLFSLLDAPERMLRSEALLVLAALLMTGAVLHMQVLGGTFGFRGRAYLAPVVAAVIVSALVLALVG
ncbi:hypothetical protein [Tropicimonas sp. IMCC34043]|uniref:hypothetical protein n=1 Tax=Tropicimonas sp. IMCC34043 TaxID=2248760 RepID=UPI001300610D|nr:hypothetical protein [Tropicimonas sp. IMCC34043]